MDAQSIMRRLLPILFASFLFAVSACVPTATSPAPAAPETVPAVPPLPPTTTSAPSPTPLSTEGPLTLSATSTSKSPAAPPSLCQPGQLEAYLQAASPFMDELAKTAQEARKLDALPQDRLKALSEMALNDRERLAEINPPACLEAAHQAMLAASTYLEEALQALLLGDPTQGEEALRSSFELMAQSIALTAFQVMEATATSTPEP